MIPSKIKARSLSLFDSLRIFTPSTLKYWYSEETDLFISRSSALWRLISISFNCLLRKNQVGIHQYVANTPKHASPQRAIDSVNKARDKIDIVPTPAAADLRITFRSLLINLAIGSSYIVGSIYRKIIPQKSLLVSFYLTTMLCFSNISIASASTECLTAITKYEQLYRIPTGLLKAVSKVESEYNPLALNDGLKEHNFKTKHEVINRINYLVDIGKTNFDIGCMQINYYWHGKNFASVEEMLDVSWNVRYAAALIHGLYKDHGTWQAAVRHYHSREPSSHKIYSKKIALAWLKERTANALF
jgi:hypothetical protein